MEYKKETDWGEWRFNNSYHYAYGQGFGGSSDYSSDANPEVWRFVIHFTFICTQSVMRITLYIHVAEVVC